MWQQREKTEVYGIKLRLELEECMLGIFKQPWPWLG